MGRSLLTIGIYIYRVAGVDVGVVLQMLEDLVQVTVACRT